MIPILMYHSISKKKETTKHQYYDINVTPEIFNKQMEFLFLNNFKVIDLEKALEYRNKNINRNKFIVVTFDDGYRDFYTTAYPILEKYGFTATVFLSTNYIANNYNKSRKNYKYLNWKEVMSLYNKGIK